MCKVCRRLRPQIRAVSKCHDVVAVAYNQREHVTGDAIKRDVFQFFEQALDFCKSEAEVMDGVDTFQRANSIIENEMTKNLENPSTSDRVLRAAPCLTWRQLQLCSPHQRQ